MTTVFVLCCFVSCLYLKVNGLKANVLCGGMHFDGCVFLEP